MEINHELREQLTRFQRTEITEYHINRRLASAQKSPENREVLEKIAQDELGQYQLWKEHTRRDVQPSWFRMWFYNLLSSLIGFTFGVRLMERSEVSALLNYSRLQGIIPDIDRFIHVAGSWKWQVSAWVWRGSALSWAT